MPNITPKGGKKNRKLGRNLEKCRRYRLENRREKNKARKMAKNLRRQERATCKRQKRLRLQNPSLCKQRGKQGRANSGDPVKEDL